MPSHVPTHNLSIAEAILQVAHKARSNTPKVRFSMPPLPLDKSKKRRQHSTSNSSSTSIYKARNAPITPTPTPAKLLVAQLSSPTLNTRAEFDLAYKIIKSTTSYASKQLAMTLCRGDIAEISSRLAENSTQLDRVLETAQEQVEKLKVMEQTWRPDLPSSAKEFAPDKVVGKNKDMKEAMKVFDEMRWEYERFITYLDWIEELKVEREKLLEDRNLTSVINHKEYFVNAVPSTFI
ncbi:hypothetical protein TSTA_111980 [Talaromyces stipitatus ATCC 10500]|uniref:Uncharacterized protein n=1 Tax=Talaromyces stipitatus (strain ATCC 10500 / CBS 375.48 / QM 6759 / NRRL 1006) TaxID=441959 RepID=B8M967_TALSN|nr:uncharacterized protein TSTA_111980 [Talaromyces stipitatus ATCC 10500]EED17362.1 hypothetical protein TSTA_111980 [Talaromyces stipitatus ATCC 10500]